MTSGIPGEVFVTIGGVRKYLWRAVDQHGNVLDILIQGKRDGKAATRFFRTLLKKQGHTPRVLVTDKLASYRVAHRQTMSATKHRQNKFLNNRCENSHQPTRQREHAMKGFRSVGSAQRFLASFSRISSHFRPPRHRMALPTAPSPDDRHRSPHRTCRPIPGMGSGHRTSSRCLTDDSV
ncbi:IS6 family transposase [Rhodococcus erythropolis]|uniref:IS6 family transposase n=1 Tax=Rhodococcus erythropolis TaxID=1833 RepID=UPI0039827F6F